MRKIGLFGFGTVGKGFYEILKQYPGLPVQIEKVCIKREDLKREAGHGLYFTGDMSDILNDRSIDIVIEVTDDAVAAKKIVHRALKNGKAVISANKKMIAESMEEISQWHRQYNASFLYEASAGGGIPIIHAIDSSFKDYRITKIRGILNGSSNYILTQMLNQRWTFNQALSNAQKMGFAESDPTLDIAGMDAAFKLTILAYHSFGEIASLNDYELKSIEGITHADIQQAKKENKKIKPIASIFREASDFYCSVSPEWIGMEDALYNIDHEDNAISVETELSGTYVLAGKGAGSLPTGSAIFSDLKRVINGYKYRL